MTRTLLPMTLIVASLAQFAATPCVAADRSPRITPPKELADLPARWKQAMKDLHIPGMAVVVVKDGKVVMLETLGVRDPRSKKPVTEHTPFYIASCTKTFVAMAILQLVEEGKIDLDAPVKKYLPRFELADAAATKRMTVRDLLSHAKGLSSGPIVWLDAYTGDITEDRYYKFLRAETPKGSFEYTNVHYTLAGRIVHEVSGYQWQDYLQQRILSPAGMTDATCLADEMYARKDTAIPTQFINGNITPARARKTDRTMHAAGGMGASVSDLAKWLKLNLNGGKLDETRLLSATNISAMQTLEAKRISGRGGIPGRKRRGYGLGWNVTDYKGETMLEHGGGYVGTSAMISIIPDKKIGVAIVGNSDTPLPIIASNEVLDRLLGAEMDDLLPMLKKRAERRATKQLERANKLGKNPVAAKNGLSASPEAYAGVYTNVDWGKIKMSIEKGKLVGLMGDLPMDVASTGTDAFSSFDNIGSTQACQFVVDDQGIVTGITVKEFDDDEQDVLFTKQ